MLIVTNAPESYDYGYMETFTKFEDTSGKVWRTVLVHDEYRYENYQQYRYASGMYVSAGIVEWQEKFFDSFLFPTN